MPDVNSRRAGYAHAAVLVTHVRARARAQPTVSCLKADEEVLMEACVQAQRGLDPPPAGFPYDVDMPGQTGTLRPGVPPQPGGCVAQASGAAQLLNRLLELQEQPDLFDP